MTNYGSKIFNNGVSALNAQQAVIAGISNNIANATTPGYARRAVLLQNQNGGEGTSGLNIGSGVKVGEILRYVDEFTNTSLRQSLHTQASATIKDDLLARVESVFDLTGTSHTIGSSLTNFFGALNDLSVNPSSIELRANFIERAQDLVNTIKASYENVANLQREIDTRIVTELDTINTLTSQIAQLNQTIVQREGAGNLAADDRDRRDNLLNDLSKKLSFTTLELEDGSVKITLPSGLDLVFGASSRNLEITTSPTFGTGTLPTTMWGGVPGFIVYNYGSDVAPAHVDLTSVIASGEGTLGGLLEMRGSYNTTDTSPFQGNGILPEVGARIEAITYFLLQNFNTQYLGADEDSGTAGHQASSADLDGLPPEVYGLFDFQFAGVKDTDGNGLPDDLGTHAGVTNYSSLLRITNTDPRSVAASLDLDPTTQGSTSFAQGDGSNLAALAGLQSLPITHTVGNFTLNGTVEQVYVNTIGYVGNAKSRAAAERAVSDANYKLAADRRDSISGVSLDEEFAQLIRFQKSFEAAARLIRTGNELLDQVINLI